MILSRLDGSIHFYRAHTPQWSSQPLSGAGAARKGGRFNRAGVHALYLSGSSATAIAEYQQLSSLLPPLTLATYLVTLDLVVDFRGGYEPERWNSIWQDADCDWRRLAFYERTEPPSWVIADLALDAGARGILFPSLCDRDGFNLVIFLDAMARSDHLSVYDPDRQLPLNRESWPQNA